MIEESNNTVLIRNFHGEKDIQFAAHLTKNESWHSETASELLTYYQHDPQGCLIAEQNRKPVGICVATPYLNSGFIGELIVDKTNRNQGIGQQLMKEAIHFLFSKGIKTIFLDGVKKALPIYLSLGFSPLYRSLRFFGQVDAHESPEIRQITKKDWGAIFELDLTVFGEDRSFFLRKRFESYPELSFVKESEGKIQSLLLGRVGNGGWVSAGPWIMNPENLNPLEILTHFQAKIGNQPFSIGILEPNTSIISQIVLAGMQPANDPPTRMKLGNGNDLGIHSWCMAIGSPAQG